jgi:hypothetical protein
MNQSGYTPSNVGGWEVTKLRNDFLGANGVGQVLAQSYPNVAAAIKPVSKTSLVYDGDNQTWSDQTTTDRLWVPSIREVYGMATGFRIGRREESGPIYFGGFRTSSDLIRAKPGSVYSESWWLRTTATGEYSSKNFSYSYGDVYTEKANYSRVSVLLGFCI